MLTKSIALPAYIAAVSEAEKESKQGYLTPGQPADLALDAMTALEDEGKDVVGDREGPKGDTVTKGEGEDSNGGPQSSMIQAAEVEGEEGLSPRTTERINMMVLLAAKQSKNGSFATQDSTVEDETQTLSEILTVRDYLAKNRTICGGWRAALYRTDGTLDLALDLKLWDDSDKVQILQEQVHGLQREFQRERAMRRADMDELKKTITRQRLHDAESLREDRDLLARERSSCQAEMRAFTESHSDLKIYERVRRGVLDGTIITDEVLYREEEVRALELSVKGATGYLKMLCRRYKVDFTSIGATGYGTGTERAAKAKAGIVLRANVVSTADKHARTTGDLGAASKLNSNSADRSQLEGVSEVSTYGAASPRSCEANETVQTTARTEATARTEDGLPAKFNNSLDFSQISGVPAIVVPGPNPHPYSNSEKALADSLSGSIEHKSGFRGGDQSMTDTSECTTPRTPYQMRQEEEDFIMLLEDSTQSDTLSQTARGKVTGEDRPQYDPRSDPESMIIKTQNSEYLPGSSATGGRKGITTDRSMTSKPENTCNKSYTDSNVRDLWRVMQTDQINARARGTMRPQSALERGKGVY